MRLFWSSDRCRVCARTHVYLLFFSDPFKGCVSRTVNALASVYGFVAAPFDAAIGAVSVWQPAKITVDARIQVILKNSSF